MRFASLAFLALVGVAGVAGVAAKEKAVPFGRGIELAQATPGVSDPHGGKIPGPAADTAPSDGAGGGATGGKNASSDPRSGATSGQTAVPSDTGGEARNPAEAEQMKDQKSR